MKADIAKHPTWTGRLEHAANLLMKTGKFKDQKEIEMAADLFYKRILICCNYTPTRKLIAKVALIRARQKINAFDQIGNDYGLCEVGGNQWSFLLPVVNKAIVNHNLNNWF